MDWQELMEVVDLGGCGYTRLEVILIVIHEGYRSQTALDFAFKLETVISDNYF